MAMVSASTWVLAYNKVTPLNNQICAIRRNYLARGYQGLHVKQAKINVRLEVLVLVCS